MCSHSEKVNMRDGSVLCAHCGKLLSPPPPPSGSDVGKRLEEIRKRADAATKGPWEVAGEWGDIYYVSEKEEASYIGTSDAVPDQDFIAHARDDIPFLLALIARLEAENAEKTKALDAAIEMARRTMAAFEAEYPGTSEANDDWIYDTLGSVQSDAYFRARNVADLSPKSQTNGDGKPTIIKKFPGQAVDAHLKERGILPGEVDYAAMQPGDMLNAVGDDAAKWADAFMQFNRLYGVAKDRDTMLGWFANAIERSSDVRRWRREGLSITVPKDQMQ